ncbi:hypothetical protein ACM46_04090 [Chryseobacterium angstadtii]|uniref:PBCV-specific basic adaptor domain-containing protein n=1 Tax=Chryseobacterium angstadtii TaxID=558151 RepID=A0A0J7ILD8_9FLAO|nr:hypothetical protein [Chryseobacterium angstadtii]KMQ66699.1 hypothetical protein ACM46_04090 [Chryseobacterium angstadtii]
MKKLLFTTLLAAGLLFPASLIATENSSPSKTELSPKKQKKKTKKSNKSSGSKKPRSFYSSNNKSCTYNGNQLYVGSRGGCYYYAGSSKQYVDRSYCSGCN